MRFWREGWILVTSSMMCAVDTPLLLMRMSRESQLSDVVLLAALLRV